MIEKLTEFRVPLVAGNGFTGFFGTPEIGVVISLNLLPIVKVQINGLPDFWYELG